MVGVMLKVYAGPRFGQAPQFFFPRELPAVNFATLERMKTLLLFACPEDFRAWLQKHHATETEAFVSYYKKSSGKKSMTYLEAVDEALCYGWIDGVGRRIDDERASNRFTPRKKGSTWSLRNIGRVKALLKENRMQPAGMKAYEARSTKKTGVYAFENKDKSVLDPASEKLFKSNKKAWAFFQSCPAWYRRTTVWLVISAKKEETRAKRLKTLSEDSAAGRTIKQLTRNKGV